MAKDWEYWKNEFINDQAEKTLKKLKLIEENLTSPIEKIAFTALVHLRESFQPGNLIVRSQEKIGQYIADFVVEYLPEKEIFVVECDGHEFHEKNKQQAAHDKARDRFFLKEGYKVLRYMGSEITENPYQINYDILDVLLKSKARSKEGV